MSGAEDESDENEEDDDESSDSGNIIITFGNIQFGNISAARFENLLPFWATFKHFGV